MFRDILSSVYIPKIGFGDIVEIIILIITLYKINISISKTRAVTIVRGIACMFLIYAISYLFGFDVIVVIFQNLITVCLLACVLIFQPELRKFIEKIGTEQRNKTIKLSKILFKDRNDTLWYSDKTIDELVDACDRMSKVKTGALIVIERDIPLTEYITSGIDINANISAALLINIFEKNTPLHDGAVIMEGDSVVSATCYLPLSSNGDIDKNMGTRHRAAIGVSEVTDCIVLTVSEETGEMSFVQDGKIRHGLDRNQLSKELKKHQIRSAASNEKKVENPLKLLKNNFGIKVISAMVAIVGWVVLMNIYNPVDTATYKNIPITVENVDLLASMNKTYKLDRETVDLRVSTTRRELDRLNNSDITVVADMEKLTLANTIQLEATVNTGNDYSVKVDDSEFVKVDIDELVSGTFNIEPSITLNSSISEDWDISNSTSEVDSVSVSGASKIIGKIGSIRAVGEVKDGKYSQVISSELKVFDKNGEDITSQVNLNKDKVNVRVYLDGSKNIKINIETNEINSKDDYEIWKVKYSTESIKVFGSESALNSITKLDIPIQVDMNNINISNNEAIVKVSIKDYLPDGVKIKDGNDTVNVTLTFNKMVTKTVYIEPTIVKIKNIPAGLIVSKVGDTIAIEISGPASDIDGLSGEDLKPYIDIQGKTAGKYTMALSFENQNLIYKNHGNIDIEIAEKVFKPAHSVTEKPQESSIPLETVTPVPTDGVSDSGENTDNTESVAGTDTNNNVNSNE